MARDMLPPSFSDSLNISLPPSLSRSLPIPVFLASTPPPPFWAVLPVHVFMTAPVSIIHTPFPSADLRGQHSFPALKQAFCLGLFFQGLPGLQSCLPVAGIDLVGTHSPSWLYLRRSSKFGSGCWGRDGHIGMRVHSRVRQLVLKSSGRIGRLAMGRMVAWAGLRLGNSPLLGGF